MALLFLACGPKFLNEKEYLNYLRSAESGLTQHQLLNGVDYCLTYLPPEYMSLMRRETVGPESDSSSKKGQTEPINFTLLLQDEDKDEFQVKSLVNTGDFNAVLQYANSDMKQDVRLLVGYDTLYCSLLHMEPANSLLPMVRISMVFFAPASQDLKDGFTLLYNDRIFNKGPLRYNYTNRLMAALPQLKR